VKTADQKRAVARPQLGNSDALASEPAESPVELWTDVCHESVVVRIVRVTKLAGMDLLCSVLWIRTFPVARLIGTVDWGRVVASKSVS